MADLKASFAKPFAQQIAALQIRLAQLKVSPKWTDLWKEEHERAFTVAGALKADMLSDLAGAVERAIGDHRSIDEFRRDFRKIVDEHGWPGKAGQGSDRGFAWRTKVIYRTNMATSYAAGRMAQLVKLDYKFWVYKHGNSLEPRLQHLAWDGVALPPDHPFWATHAPPNGWGCTCRITGADSAAGVRRAGGDPDKTLPDGWQEISAKTGAPVGIDKGWDYKVGGSVADEINAFVEQKIAKLPTQIGKDMLEAVGNRGLADIEEARLRRVIDEILPGVSEDIFQRAEATVGSQLSLVERAAVNLYTQPGFYLRLNDHLRTAARGGRPDATLDWVAHQLNSALGRLPNFEGQVFRGIDADTMLQAKFASFEAGSILEFTAFTSSAASPNAALAGEVQLIIKSKTGKRIRDFALMPHEDEVLFAQGTRFRVLGTRIDHSPGYPVRVIDLEELDGPADQAAIALMLEGRS